jgi:hypothetical protein
MKNLIVFTALIGCISAAYATAPVSNESSTQNLTFIGTPFSWYFKNNSDKPLTHVEISAKQDFLKAGPIVAASYEVVPAHTRMPNLVGYIGQNNVWSVSYTVDGLKFESFPFWAQCDVYKENIIPGDPIAVEVDNYLPDPLKNIKDSYVANGTINVHAQLCDFITHTPVIYQPYPQAR